MACDPMTDAGVRHRRQLLVDGGFAWLPEISGKKFTVKEYGDWRDRWGTFDPSITYQGRYGLLLNTALYLDSLYAVDLDIDDPRDVCNVLSVMSDTLGMPVCVRHRANSPRMAALYRCTESDGLYRGLKGSDGGIEVLTGARSKLTAFGIHTSKETGVRTRLEWDAAPGDVRKDELMAITAEQRDAFLMEAKEWLGDDVSERIGQPKPGGIAGTLVADDLDELYDATLCIPNTGTVDWHSWNRIGMALFAGSGGADLGLAAFCEWTLKNPATRHRDCLQRWRDYSSCPPTTIGCGTIFKLAFANGYEKPAKKEAREQIKRRDELTKLRAMSRFKPCL